MHESMRFSKCQSSGLALVGDEYHLKELGCDFQATDRDLCSLLQGDLANCLKQHSLRELSHTFPYHMDGIEYG